MKIFSRTLLTLAILALVLSPIASHADTFDYSFGGAAFGGSGTFTAALNNGNVYNITGVTGSVTDIFGQTSAVNSLLGVNAFGGNNNLLYYPGNGYNLGGKKFFDSHGVSFSLNNGNDIRLYDGVFFDSATGGPAGGYDLTELVLNEVTPGDNTPAVPEPSTLVLLGTGLLGLAGTMRKKLAVFSS